MDDLLTDFVAETREMLEASAGELVAWELDPSDTARLDAIFRFVHTVKGNCGFFDFPRLEKLSHAAEGVLAEVRAGRRQPDALLVNAVLAIMDRIGELVDSIEAGEELHDTNDQRLIAALEPGESDLGETADCHQPQDSNTSNSAKPALQRSIRLPVDLLDRVMSGVSDLVLARNDLARRLRDDAGPSELDGPFDRLSGILTDVREAVTRMRMQRISHLFNVLPRMVRDLSAELGKQVLVDIEGGDVELDREMIENIRDPLTHLIRNAIDHGIETPAKRLAAGKREIGLLSVLARQSGNRITITITDDGSGLNHDAIAKKAIASEIVSAKDLAAMSREEVLQLIFLPGLTTKETATAVSGRGVGMDVVRANLEHIGGSIRTDSVENEGTVFTLEIPLTLSMISALTISIGDQRFAIPRSFVEEIVHASSSALDIVSLGERNHVTYRGNRIACLSAAEALGLPAATDPAGGVFIMVRLSNDGLFALHADRILDYEDLVVKPLAPAIMRTKLYAGSTLLDDGKPILMLDVACIAQQNGLVDPSKTRRVPLGDTQQPAANDQTQTMLVYSGFDGRRMAIMMDQIRRIETVEASAAHFDGGITQIVVDGNIYPLEGLCSSDELPAKLRLLHASDGITSVMIAVRQIIDTLPVENAIIDRMKDGKVLIGGEIASIVDGYSLFSQHARNSLAENERLTCRIPADNEWAEKVLAPLIKHAGHSVTIDAGDTADVAFEFAEGDITNQNAGGAVIRLRNSKSAKGAQDSSIYRYDRETLLAALQKHAGGAA